MKITVLGATGGVGRQVVSAALADGHEVTVLARTPAKVTPASGPRIIQGDALEVQDVLQAVRGADVVISALGTTKGPDSDTSLRRMAATLARALHDASHGPDLPRVVWCASEGIYGEIPGLPGKLAMKLLAKPLADHRAAIQTLEDAGVPLTVARPRALNDKPLDPSWTEVVDGPAEGGYSIPRASVAHFLLKAAEDDSYVGKSVALAVPKH